eukprot:c38776_g1_i1.p1 GENE.c38776_g1_i1~~c38776_g1_i1.p1  ORF type:complete len:1066 (+),score=222.14 c38776_g1_i1:1-3198(+)
MGTTTPPMMSHLLLTALLIGTASAAPDFYSAHFILKRLSHSENKISDIKSCKNLLVTTIQSQAHCSTFREVANFVETKIDCTDVFNVTDICEDPCFGSLKNGLTALLEAADKHCERIFNQGCLVDGDDCFADETCIDGHCEVNCASDDQCSCDKTCSDGVCLEISNKAFEKQQVQSNAGSTCSGDGDCFGSKCFGGVCRESCPNGVCGDGLKCFRSFCVEDSCECRRDQICGPVVNGANTCLRVCQANSDCSNGAECNKDITSGVGVCQRNPCTGVTCGNTETCVKGQCLKTCANGGSCGQGTACKGNVCVPVQSCGTGFCGVDQVCALNGCKSLCRARDGCSNGLTCFAFSRLPSGSPGSNSGNDKSGETGSPFDGVCLSAVEIDSVVNGNNNNNNGGNGNGDNNRTRFDVGEDLRALRVMLGDFICVEEPHSGQFCGDFFLKNQNQDKSLAKGGNSGSGGNGGSNSGNGGSGGNGGNNGGDSGDDGFPPCDKLLEFGCCLGQFFQCSGQQSDSDLSDFTANIQTKCPATANTILASLRTPCEACSGLADGGSQDDGGDNFDSRDLCSFLPIVWPDCDFVSHANCNFTDAVPSVLSPSTNVFCRRIDTQDPKSCFLTVGDSRFPCSSDVSGKVDFRAIENPQNTVQCFEPLQQFFDLCFENRQISGNTVSCPAQVATPECCALSSLLQSGCGQNFEVPRACRSNNRFNNFFRDAKCFENTPDHFVTQCNENLQSLGQICTIRSGDRRCPNPNPSAACCQQASFFVGSGCPSQFEETAGCTLSVSSVSSFVSEACGSIAEPVVAVNSKLRLAGLDVTDFDRSEVRGALTRTLAALCSVTEAQISLRRFRRLTVAATTKSGSSVEVEYSVAVPQSQQNAVVNSLTGQAAQTTLAESLQSELSSDPATSDLVVSSAELDTPVVDQITDNTQEFEVCFSVFSSENCTKSDGSSGIAQQIAQLLGDGNTVCTSTNGLSCDGVDNNPASLISTACSDGTLNNNALFTAVCNNLGTLNVVCDSLDQCCSIENTLSVTVKCQLKTGNSASSFSTSLAWALPILMMAFGRYLH